MPFIGVKKPIACLPASSPGADHGSAGVDGNSPITPSEPRTISPNTKSAPRATKEPRFGTRQVTCNAGELCRRILASERHLGFELRRGLGRESVLGSSRSEVLLFFHPHRLLSSSRRSETPALQASYPLPAFFSPHR